MYLHDHVGPPRNLATVQCPRSTSVQRPMTLDQRIARLRLRRRMFLLGPPTAFVLLATTLFSVRSLPAWLVGALVLVAAIGSAVSVWWAPAGRCPSCQNPMGGKWLSAEDVLWVWQARPRCPKCRFDPFE